MQKNLWRMSEWLVGSQQKLNWNPAYTSAVANLFNFVFDLIYVL